MNNQECKIRPRIVNVNSDEPVFFPFIIKTSKCSGTCNYINDTFAKLCVPNMAKIIKLKVFNLMSRTGETRHIKFYETCKCKCRLDASKELIVKVYLIKVLFGIEVIENVNVINHVILVSIYIMKAVYVEKD